MDESLDANSTKKRNIPANVPIKAAKKKRFNEENSKKGESRVHSIPLNDWMINMGATLADRLETIASERSLTILQVKRLLKDVLTNPVVINAFRQYMSGQITLLEPETGEPSTTTMRHAQLLGFDAASFSRRFVGKKCSASDFADLISHRVLTRSVVTQLRNKMSAGGSSLARGHRRRKPSRRRSSTDGDKSNVSVTNFASCGGKTLLEMQFSEGEEEEAAEKTEDPIGKKLMVSVDPSEKSEFILPGPSSSSPCREASTFQTSVSAIEQDEDYQPTTDDIRIMQRDLVYDRGDDVDIDDSLTSADENVNEEDDSLNDTLQTVRTVDSPHRDYCLRSKKDGEADCCVGLTPSLLHMLNEDGVDFGGGWDDKDPTLAQAMKFPLQLGENDPDEQIYLSFLKSLFDSAPSVSSPREEPTETPVVPEPVRTTPVQSDLLKVATTTNDSRAIGEDFDDPDFDVMAEIDAICCEDLFDELRTDRAVRISKMEAKELRRELVELFQDEDFDRDELTDADLTTSANATTNIPSPPTTTKTTIRNQRWIRPPNAQGEFSPLLRPPL